MGKIWLALLGVLLCTPVYASPGFITGYLIGSSHKSGTVGSGGISVEARVYSCYIPSDIIDNDTYTNKFISKCAQRLQRLCPTCILGRLHSVAENENGVNINFEIVDTEETIYGRRKGSDSDNDCNDGNNCHRCRK